MARYAIQGVCRNNSGDVVPDISVVVADEDTANPSIIFALKGDVSPVVGSEVISDANGHWIFWIDDEDYPFPWEFNITYTGVGITTTTYYGVR